MSTAHWSEPAAKPCFMFDATTSRLFVTRAQFNELQLLSMEPDSSGFDAWCETLRRILGVPIGTAIRVVVVRGAPTVIPRQGEAFRDSPGYWLMMDRA